MFRELSSLACTSSILPAVRARADGGTVRKTLLCFLNNELISVLNPFYHYQLTELL